jgi:hypothetical protein
MSRVHSYDKLTNKVKLCGLGVMGIGAMDVDYNDNYLDYEVCTGCIQNNGFSKLTPMFNKKGKLKDFIEDL